MQPAAAPALVEGVLVVVPPVPNGNPAGLSDCVIAGLPLVRRIVLAARSAGFAQVLVRDVEPGTRRLLDGTAATLLTTRSVVGRPSRRRVVTLPANVVPQVRWLRSLLEAPIARETLYVDPSLAVVVDTDDPARIIDAAARATDASTLVAELRPRFPAVAQPADPDGRFPLVASRDVQAAEAWLLASLVKQREGFMSRHFERRLSLALTRRLAPTAVTPNAMTLTSAAIGLAGAPFFLSASPAWQLAGALLFLAHSVLDGCDGEIARLKFQQSRWGAVLDYWGDNVVHVAVFACIAVGWSLSIGAAWPLALGLVAAAATLGSAALMFERTAEDRVAAAGAAGRLIDALGNRDFIYVVVLLSAFGKAAWFLVAAAVGAPAFVVLVVWLERRHGRLF